jgi:ribosomal protein L37AE/L43A
MTREESAESYGYQKGSCPRCHRTCWSDTGVFECSHCGLDSGADEPEEEEEEEPESSKGGAT